MEFSSQTMCIALFVTLTLGIVSSQSNGTMTNTGTNKTQADPVGKGTLECYKCSSFRKEHHCDNPSEDKTPTVVCEADEHMCRKVEQHINYEGDDHVRVYRECAKTGDLGECSERTGTYQFKSWYLSAGQIFY
ncbi:hypothetical protein RRG08_036769 [Elysia crispata]|uniref:Uncharacterized protein n=1 Tax=Elysia crispata TaxID=231223 RepID=A0AAE0Y9Y1_9GAST|nr:hypothetical protein RRG08_036769 [Elysia crispata]